MVDTISFWAFMSELREDCPVVVEESSLKLASSDRRNRKRIRFRDKERGVRIKGNDDGGYFVHVSSLSRFYLGTNGRLLKTPAELEAAFNALLAWLAQFLTPPKSIQFTRIDLCWQFRGDVKLFLVSHQSITHPGIHDAPFYKDGESVWFGSKYGVLRIRIYDKLKELTNKPGDIIRVEISLSKRKLAAVFNNGAPVTSLDFNVCYRAYRGLLLQFHPKPQARLSNGAGKIAAFLALGEMEGWRSNGRRVLEVYLDTFTPKAASRLRKEVNRAKVQMGAIHWPDLLPESNPPEPVEIL